MSAPEPSRGVFDEFWCKNRLQEYTQRASIPLPVYQTYNEGAQHAPHFRSRVWVDGACFISPNIFSNRKMAEQDAAKHALTGIREKVKTEGSSRILEDIVFCKSIINEYALKMNLRTPIYVTNESKALLPVFVSSLELNGITYIGDAGRNKKEAEQFAARAAISSILDSEPGTTMSEKVKSKFKFYDALKKVKDSSSIHASTIQVSNVATGVTPVSAIQGSIVAAGVTPVSTIQDSSVAIGVTPVSTIQGSTVAVGVTPVSTIQGSTVVAGVAPLDNSLVSFSKQKEVEIDGSSVRDPIAAILQSTLAPLSTLAPFPAIQLAFSESASEQPSHTPSTHQPLHVFKKLKPDTSSAAIAPPIVFVPPASEQASENPPMCSTSGKKRNRKNKKAKRKLLAQSQSTIIAMPQSQVPACSVTPMSSSALLYARYC